MQLCPSCNTPLPDKASFCAHCGYKLNATDKQAPQMLDTPELSGIQASSDEQSEAQAFSTAPNTPRPDEAQDAEEQIALILPSSQDIAPAAETSEIYEETLPTSSDTPLSVPSDESDIQTALAFPTDEATPLPVELPTDEDTPLPVELPTDEDTPLPVELPTGEDTPLPVELPAGEAQNTLEVQPPSQTPLLVEPTTGKDHETLETQMSLPMEFTANEDNTLEVQPSSQTPLPVEPTADEDDRTLEAQTPSQTPPLAESTADEDDKALEVKVHPQAPSLASAPSIEEQKPPVLPPPAKRAASSYKPEVAEQETRTLPSPSSKSAISQRAEIAEQETRAVPVVPKTPLPQTETNKGNNRSMIEVQKTASLTTAEKPGRSNLPGSQSRTRVDNDSTIADERENQQNGKTITPLRPMPSAPLPKLAPKPVRTIGALIWSFISPVFKRARDPEPEKPRKPLAQFMLLGWLPIIALTSSLGLFTTTVAFNAARDNAPGAELYYWLGLGLIYIPVVVRLIMPHPSRAERVGLLCVTTICLFLTKVSLSPLYYSGYDEFLHWRTINDILSTGHLFTKNPLLPVSPFYPGLEIVTSALSNISGLSSIQAGFTVVGVANLITILSLFLLAELLSNSARLASITAVIYMANPHFLFFDTQFAYESLAIPLAMVVMLAMTRYEALNSSRRWVMLVAWIVLVALDLTHHATNFIFEGLFLLWAIVYLFLRPLPLRKTIVIPTVLGGLALTAVTIVLIGNTVIGYFTSFFADISSEIAQDLGSAGGGSRQLFGGGAVIPTPLWERLISLGSVGLITLAIPFLLLCFWRRYRRNTLVWVFAIIIVFYPVLQVLRLTTSGAEISDRSSAFIFIAISFLGAVAIVQFWPVRLFNWKHSTVISAAILVLFMGGIILGEGIPPSFLPGPYEASADARSIDPEGIQAALWTYAYLGPNQRMYTDRINQLLMSVYGDQYLVTKIGDNVDVTDVIFDPTVGPYEISRLQQGKVHYLAIDLRLSTQLPQDGFYYEQGESTTGPNGDTTAINRALLTKFDGVPQINRFFDSGNIVIYDTGGLINAPALP